MFTSIGHEWNGPYVLGDQSSQLDIKNLSPGMGTLHGWESFGDGVHVSTFRH